MTAIASRVSPPATAPALAPGVAPTVAAVVLTGVAAGLAARGDSRLAVLLVVAAAGIAAVVAPRRLAILLVLATVTLLPSRFGAMSFGGVRTDIPELLMLAVIAVYAVHLLLGATPRASRFTVPVLLVVAAAAFGAAVALQGGASRTAVLGPFKSYLWWLLPIPFAGLFADRAGRDTIERWVVGVATAGGLVVLVLAATGAGVPSGDDVEVVTLGVTSAAQRLRPALVQLSFLAVLLLTARITVDRATPRRWASLAISLAVLGLSFNRSTWAALALCVVLFLRWRPGGRDVIVGTTRAAIALGVLVAVLVVGATGAVGPTAQAMSLRARSVVTPDVLAEKSLEDRAEENDSAIAALRERPVTGVGLGQPYGARRGRWSPDHGAVVFHDRLFIHNSALGVWLWLGLPGVIAVSALGVAIVRVTRWTRRSLPPVLAARALAGSLCVLGMAVQALVQTKLTHRPTLVVIALALTLLDAPEESR